MSDQFELHDFLPYLLNRAAEATSLAFQDHYKRRYGMLRTEWRVLVHLGRYGKMTAKDIANRAGIHKTKISRAVAALEKKRFLARSVLAADRRHEVLALTRTGLAAYDDLCQIAAQFDKDLVQRLGTGDMQAFKQTLQRIAALRPA